MPVHLIYCSHTPVQPQRRTEINEPAQSIIYEPEPILDKDQSVRDLSLPAQTTFVCDPSVHWQMRREIERLSGEKEEALQTIGQAELRIQDLELKQRALHSDLLYYTKLSETYCTTCDRLRDNLVQSVQMINTLLTTLLQRTKELQLVSTALIECTAGNEELDHPAPMGMFLRAHYCVSFAPRKQLFTFHPNVSTPYITE
ncbi:hypothetical protein FBUS_03661 [Fasciolopsis buskii]|uniref:Uncharacterized protein n=1 Tax=Fasciolopsis buskii TaxID=27845 RepID=A0A8E0RSF0_9TREM|nr:hypothetical protein FBUS_03661 [Fasciolopsis buski]